jgi:hypothetical protein
VLTAPGSDLARHVIEFDPRLFAGYVFAAAQLSARACQTRFAGTDSVARRVRARPGAAPGAAEVHGSGRRNERRRSGTRGRTTDWVSVRNASDPQMDGPDLATETVQAVAIYEKCGQITSWGSALGCWALMAHGFGDEFRRRRWSVVV